MKNLLNIQIQQEDGAIKQVTARVNDSDLALPFEEFAERFLRPAFTQLAAEMKA